MPNIESILIFTNHNSRNAEAHNQTHTERIHFGGNTSNGLNNRLAKFGFYNSVKGNYKITLY